MPPEPWVLALNTASETLSVALAHGDTLVAEAFALPVGPKAHHAERVMVAVDRVCREAGVVPASLAAIAVAVGPGGFTGVRTALAAAKAAALALGIPLVGVSTLDALAEQAAATGLVAAMVDARKGDVFAGLYRKRPGSLEVVKGSELAPGTEWIAAVTREAGAERVVFVGEGAIAHAVAVGDRWPGGERRDEDHRLRAASVARLGVRRLRAGETDDPLQLLPLYLREPSATPNLARIGPPPEARA